MKKLMVVLSSLLVASSMLFAASGDSKEVRISTTIDQYAAISVNSTTAFDTEKNLVTEKTLKADGSVDSFYVTTRSNDGKGIKVTYTMSALKGTDTNNDVIPVSVYLGGSATADKSFTTKNVESGASALIDTESTNGTEDNFKQVDIRTDNANWATSVKADTYSATITFTLTAK